MNTYSHSLANQGLLLLAVLWNDFLPWYLLKKPLNIIKDYFAYASVLWRICSFVFLIKTLFAPWKNISDSYPDHWFDIVGVARALSMNLTARSVGFMVRLGTIAFGIMLEVCVLLFFTMYLIAWILFPFAIVIGIPFLLANL